MRLDHFVQLPTTHNNKGDIMSKLETPSITSSRGFASSHLTWVKTQQKNMDTLVWGRIKDTGINFIVEGWQVVSGSSRTEWVKISCQNLATAQMYLISVMEKESFKAEQTRQAWDRLQKQGKSYQEIIEILDK
tara:strand:+ start:821 stop:1219 length:399 start_codon:yes stop_codon:yes gene_type:complete